MRTRGLACRLAVVTAALALAVSPLRAQAPVGGLTAEQVRDSIRQGRQYLLSEQRANGQWSDTVDYPGGVTALCTLALLTAGEEPNSPQIQKSLAFLRSEEPEKTYTVALQTMALCAATPEQDLPLIQKNVRFLSQTQILQGPRTGAWSYPLGDNMGGDNSNSQFAVLALHEAERVGAKVDPQVWRRAADYWQRVQNADGSWGYTPEDTGSGSMTCAGIGAWIICTEKVAAPAAEIVGESARCCLPPTEDDVLERALVWMSRNFSVRGNPNQISSNSQWHYYYLYGLERVGRLSARRFIGDHDWYREGAEFLISQQEPFSHFWEGRLHSESNPHIASSLALLFLSKGRWPVLIAKVKHEPDLDWNNHPADLANLTAYVEKQWDLDLTWQVIDGDTATVDDMLQAPVLFLSGSKTTGLENLDKKMRDYLDRGGFLFAEACCGDGADFQASLRKFLDRVFPEGEYKLRVAGPAHPIWRIDKLVRPESPYVGRLWTVEYGCRTCVVFSEVDLSCYWELFGRGRLENVPELVKERIDDATTIGLNVLAYATNREPRGKEFSFATADAPNLDALGTRGTIRIAKLIHGGGCNDAPGALVNLLRLAAQGEAKLQIATNQFDLRASDPNLPNFHMAFMHGRHDFRFTPEERENLRMYLENGGLLFADSICASKEFVAAFRREIALALPEGKLERIPPEHPIFTDAAGGFNIQQVSRREPAAGGGDQPMRSRVQQVAPELEGVAIDGRLAVIFSPYDISCALEQHEALQCRGYTREDAARIGLNVLLYSLNPEAGAPAAAK